MFLLCMWVGEKEQKIGDQPEAESPNSNRSYDFESFQRCVSELDSYQNTLLLVVPIGERLLTQSAFLCRRIVLPVPPPSSILSRIARRLEQFCWRPTLTQHRLVLLQQAPSNPPQAYRILSLPCLKKAGRHSLGKGNCSSVSVLWIFLLVRSLYIWKQEKTVYKLWCSCIY